MTISPFFFNLYSDYLAEVDHLTSDSEGKDVLIQRLADKRGELDFLVKMMELSPEMVAVVFHQAFVFSAPAVMDDLMGFGAGELPDWADLSKDIQVATWAQVLVDKVLTEAKGGEFLAVAATLEYMISKPVVLPAQPEDAEEDDPEEFEGDDEERADAKARKEAGEDWMVQQGFDEKKKP